MDDWIDAVVARESLPLLSRVHSALTNLRELAGADRARWAA
jgi:hypothetical protein